MKILIIMVLLNFISFLSGLHLSCEIFSQSLGFVFIVVVDIKLF